MQALQSTARGARLRGFEVVRAAHLTPEPFTVDNDLLTPTLKLKRHQLQRRFQRQIDDMYAEMGD